jgi:hypothetical protein
MGVFPINGIDFDNRKESPPLADFLPEEGIYKNMANGGEAKFDPGAKTKGLS